MLEISEIIISWNNTSYRLTRDAILKAFDRASEGAVTSSSPRYFMELGQDIKPVNAILREIVPVPDPLENGVSEMVARAFETLGFSVLDRGKKKGDKK